MHDQQYDYDAFISYSREDSMVAQEIAARLEKLCSNGPKPRIFLDTSSIEPGDNFVDRINTGLTRARYYLLLLSPASIEAEWPTAERDAALLGDPSGRGGRVVPILVKDCAIPPLLAIRHWIDARDKARLDAGMASLASKITGMPLSHGEAGGTATAASESITGPAALARPYSYEPDAVDETLYTNLYRVERIPAIRSALTDFPTKKVIRQELRCRLPAFVVSGGRLYTSSEIKGADNPLKRVVDTGSIEDVPFEFWLENDDNKRVLTALLNVHASHRCEGMGLTYDAIGKRYYGDKARVTSEKLRWLPHVKAGSRALIIPYENDDGIQFYRHRAIRLAFRMLGDEAFLQVNPGWTFTHDGSAVIEDRKRRSALNTRLRSHVDNDDEFAEQRFWAWLLSSGGRIEMGERGNPIRIDHVPLKFASHAGICGDHLPTPFDQGDPPGIALDGNGSHTDRGRESQ